MSNESGHAPVQHDLTLTVLSVLLMLTLIGASFWILRPFLLALLWALMIVVATWPVMLKVAARVRRRGFAVALMSVGMLVVFVAPLVFAVDTLLRNMESVTRWIKALPDMHIPPPPGWINDLPLIGARLAEQWASLAAGSREELATRLTPYAADAAQWLAGAFGSFGLFAVQFLLTIVLATILYAQGDTAREMLIRFGRALAGERGEAAVILAGQAIRSVALGVVVTALAQTILAGLGLALTGIPFAGLLTGVILLLCIAQIGPILVLVPAVIFLFWSGSTGAGIALLVWTIVVGTMDNVVRPLLIRKGADLPLLLIFAGVIGGLLAFGVVGLFIGPVMLAVAYTMLREWMNERVRVLQSSGPHPALSGGGPPGAIGETASLPPRSATAQEARRPIAAEAATERLGDRLPG